MTWTCASSGPPDQAWAAVFLRDKEPWYLDGALVGMASSPVQAFAELLAIATHLVLEGSNFLTNGPTAHDDRIWLFKVLDGGGVMSHEENERMYAVIRAANGGKDPYQT